MEWYKIATCRLATNKMAGEIREWPPWGQMHLVLCIPSIALHPCIPSLGRVVGAPNAARGIVRMALYKIATCHLATNKMAGEIWEWPPWGQMHLVPSAFLWKYVWKCTWIQVHLDRIAPSAYSSGVRTPYSSKMQPSCGEP